MSDLISRSALIEHLKRSRVRHAQTSREIVLLQRCEDIVSEQPAVEAAPVVHGEWRHIGGDEWCCSECGYVISTEGSWEKPTGKFCEECGADMRKDG